MKPLDGILVIALEQAVAAPFCTSRLADAGARVVKIERPEGDFARGYDKAVYGESSYFVWINRGKESLVLDLRKPEDLADLKNRIAKADVFIQNLAPGATDRMGIASADLRAQNPALITCDISGYGESGPLHQLKAYDLLVQAESGLVAVSGAPGPWGRIGVSICDISAGMNALIGIQQALLQRQRTGRGSGVKVSLFDSAAELMSVPYLQARYGGKAPERVGLKHPSIAPYGSFVCSDGREVVLSIQNEREWAQFCQMVLKKPEMAAHPKFSSNAARVDNRQELEEIIQAVFGKLSYTAAIDLLIEAQTAFGSINSVYDLIEHPQLRTKEMDVHGMKVHVPANPFMMEWDAESFPPIPPIGAMRESNHHAPELNQAAEMLARRFASGEHAEDLPAQIKPTNRAQGYEIQRMLPARLNDRQVGWKIAATSEAGQRHIAVSGPIAGPLMKRRVHPNASTIELKDNLMRVAECEVAFRLNQTFKPRPNPYSKEEVIAAIGALMPAIEVPDSRFRAFERAGEAQLIADGACCRDMLLGQEVPPDERMLNLPQLDIVARCNDGREFQGCGANVLGDPLNSLHWLVNEVTRHGMCVEAGQFVITGTCTTPIPVEPGNTVHADLGWVGTMQVTFS